MFPYRPVAIPDQMFDINMANYSMSAQQPNAPLYGPPQMLSSPPSAYQDQPRIVSDPVSAFQDQPQILSDPTSAFQNTSVPGVANPQQGVNPGISPFTPQPQHPYQPGQYGGAYQNLALQMAGFPGPQGAGVRQQQYMNPAAFMNATAAPSQPGELHNVNQGTHPQSPGGDVGPADLNDIVNQVVSQVIGAGSQGLSNPNQPPGLTGGGGVFTGGGSIPVGPYQVSDASGGGGGGGWVGDGESIIEKILERLKPKKDKQGDEKKDE